jgi:AAHS family 4-hydroxybenzoate transporter-like MFS transporter
MKTEMRVNLAQAIDDSQLSSFQIGIFVLCGVCLIVDGFDVQAMGYTAPAIIQEWKLPNALMAPVFSATLLGVLIGSFVFSMLADKLGRRPVMIGATLFFAVMTLATAQADSVAELRWIRFVAGLGLGGVMPNAVALCGEFSPRSSRVFVMMLVGNGFTAGAALGGFIAAWLIPHYGWRSVFYFGGAIPLLIALAMIIRLPESLQFLSVKGQAQSRIAATLRRINPAQGYPAATEFLFAVVFIAGVGVMGGQEGSNALAATFYPTGLRSTGIGAGLGVGRLGAIVGPLVGGQLMAWQWSSRALFSAAAIPALISAQVMIAMRRGRNEKQEN